MTVMREPQAGTPPSGHAARIARDHCLAPGRVDAPLAGGRYRPLYDDLPPLSVDERALHELGRAGGPYDLGVGMADAHVAAVWPFFGQYIAHDITADRSPPTHHAASAQLFNARAPKANLERLGAGHRLRVAGDPRPATRPGRRSGLG
jgi:hypothetical protein